MRYSIDVEYAYAQLGLEAGASWEAVLAVQAQARAYPFATKERLRRINELVEFFDERQRLHHLTAPYEAIRRAYYHQVKTLHPDRQKQDKVAEERLKELNAAYERIERVHKAAKAWFALEEHERRALAEEARRQTAREAPENAEPAQEPAPRRPSKPPPPRSQPGVGGKAYTAASVPRFLRQSRLSFLPVQAVIGSWTLTQADGSWLVFDIVMLPAERFERVRTYLGAPHLAPPTLSMGSFYPAYVLRDVQTVIVPEDEDDPEAYARHYFHEHFPQQGR